MHGVTGTSSLVLACRSAREEVSLASVASAWVKLVRAGGEWKGCCPFHPDRSPSFTIYADDRRFMCFGCGAQGDVLDFLMRAKQVSLSDALKLLPGVGATACVAVPRSRLERPDRSLEAAAIWSSACPATGTLAETYLRSRALHVPVPGSIRFARLRVAGRRDAPALVAAVATLQGQVLGVQRTFLRDDGSGKASLPNSKAKLSLGRVRGGAIRLGSPTGELVVTEGLEDGLTIQQETGRAVWVAAGASMLPAMDLPSHVTTVIIGSDNDEPGQASARKAAEAFSRQGRKVRIIRPAVGCKDFNDELRGVRL